MTPIRCTQNPSMDEEWRRGWHPETYARSTDPGRVLVVGGGPAGLEAAMVAARRGHEVVLVEASPKLGGRVAREARLPGLAAWIRVSTTARGQLDAMPGVECHLHSPMTAEDVLGHGFAHVAVATGSTWRRDGVGGWHRRPIGLHPDLETLTPGRPARRCDADRRARGGLRRRPFLPGRRFAEDLDGPSEDAPFRRDLPAVGSAPSAG